MLEIKGKRICLIYTGGLVDVEMAEQGHSPMPDFVKIISTLLDKSGEDLPHYAVRICPTLIKDGNVRPDDWRAVACDIVALYNDYDGFVILHDTDTMAYTASALSFMLRGLRKPVILTGSQIPLSSVGSDASSNLVCALHFATDDAINEVAIYFNHVLLRGNRATKVSTERLQAFDSPNYPWLGEWRTVMRVCREYLMPRPDNESFGLPERFDAKVLSLRFVPGMPISGVQVMLELKPEALILACYGSGNAPHLTPGLLDILAQANKEGTVLVSCSQSLHGRVQLETYEPGTRIAEAGVISAHDMTFEALFTKLHYLFAVGGTPDTVRRDLLHTLSGELTI